MASSSELLWTLMDCGLISTTRKLLTVDEKLSLKYFSFSLQRCFNFFEWSTKKKSIWTIFSRSTWMCEKKKKNVSWNLLISILQSWVRERNKFPNWKASSVSSTNYLLRFYKLSPFVNFPLFFFINVPFSFSLPVLKRPKSFPNLSHKEKKCEIYEK